MGKIKKQTTLKIQSSSKKFQLKDFPVQHYSYSTFLKFSTNPIMFKINAINHDYLEVTTNPSAVLGQTGHKALELFFKNLDLKKMKKKGIGEEIKLAQEVGQSYLESFSDGLIEFNDSMPNREKINERYAFLWTKYFQEIGYLDTIQKILIVEEKLKCSVKIKGKELPVPVVSLPDLVYRDTEGKIIIRDHKFVAKYSAEEEVDGAKMLQAVFNYFTVWEKTGERPHSIIFEEFKVVENRDKSKQLKEFEIVYADHPLMFDFFYRFYDDVTNALLGKQVYVPNLMTFFDKEVSILAYIHRLDIDEEREEAFKKLKVENITDFLKKKIQEDGNMKKYLEVVSKKFISGKTLNYKDMTSEDKIKMKLSEFGIALNFDSKIVGSAITLYCYEASIGTKMSKIQNYEKDIEQVLGISGIRVLAPIPNSSLVGFEVPNADRTFTKTPQNTSSFNLNIGTGITGQNVQYNLLNAPHMLVSGATGSGKSVFLHNIINQVQSIANAEIHLFDPKQVEFSQYEGQKGIAEYEVETAKIETGLGVLTHLMNQRYSELKKKGVKNISELTTGSMNYKIVVIDEFADLIHNFNIMESIRLLSQKGRACGIHLIIATQRASTKVISGDVKNNFTVKAVFRMSKAIDSMVMLDQVGAEKLLGKGDFLFSTAAGIERLQGYSTN